VFIKNSGVYHMKKSSIMNLPVHLGILTACGSEDISSIWTILIGMEMGWDRMGGQLGHELIWALLLGSRHHFVEA
jgi:hypothetical protein